MEISAYRRIVLARWSEPGFQWRTSWSRCAPAARRLGSSAPASPTRDRGEPGATGQVPCDRRLGAGGM